MRVFGWPLVALATGMAAQLALADDLPRSSRGTGVRTDAASGHALRPGGAPAAERKFDATKDVPAVLPADIFKAPGDPATATRVDAAASLTLRAPGHYAVTVDSPAAGLLVVSENWMPGWRVVGPRCGAEQAACAPGTWPEGGDLALLEPLRANLAFLGIPVPAGLVRFDLVYAPDSVRTGLWIGGVTLLFVLGSGVLFLWRRRRTAA